METTTKSQMREPQGLSSGLTVTGIPPGPPPGGRPPSVHETPEYHRYLWAASSHEVGSDILIPETVTDLVEKGKQHNYVQIIQDLYQILKKLSAENKSLKQSVIDQKEIIEIENQETKDIISALQLQIAQQKQKEASGGSVEQSSVLPGNESKSKFSITDAVKGKKNKNKKQQNNEPKNEITEQPPPIPPISTTNDTTIINDEDKLNAPSEERLEDLTRRLEATEMEAHQLSDALEQMSAQKTAFERDVTQIQNENQRLQVDNESLTAEKWELSAANADLQNRLQAVSYMQNVPDTMLQEEVRKLHIALSDERKVTEKLSRNLELEKRRSESLEQKAKNAFRKSTAGGAGGNSSNSAIFLPEEMRYRDEQLMDKMEKYRDQVERVTISLQECEEKLTGFEIQEEYHANDLRKELCNVKKILIDEKRRSNGDTVKINEFQSLFGAVMKSYQDSIDHMKQLGTDSKKKNNDEAMVESGGRSTRDNTSPSKMESLQSRLVHAQEEIRDERRRADQIAEKLRQCQIDLESLPLLRAQIEVYKTDFNAERGAREKIAGEKADLIDEIRQLRSSGAAAGDRLRNENMAIGDNTENTRNVVEIATGTVREAVHQFAPRHDVGGHQLQQAKASAERKTFSCPKCNKNFPILTLLQNHVNACLDQD